MRGSDAAADVLLLMFALSSCLWLTCETRCESDEKGMQHVARMRGNRVEQCDGRNWIPVKSEVSP